MAGMPRIQRPASPDWNGMAQEVGWKLSAPIILPLYLFKKFSKCYSVVKKHMT